MTTTLRFANCIATLLVLLAVRGLAQSAQPAHPPPAAATVGVEPMAALEAARTETFEQNIASRSRSQKPPKREVFTCSSSYLDRCFDSRSNCYDCSRKGIRIEPPSNQKLLLLQGKFSGMQLYEPEGVQRETYQIRSRAKVRMTKKWDHDNGEYAEIGGWKKVRRGVMECVRTEPIGRTFGVCCGACRYADGYLPNVGDPAGVCCRGCSYLKR